MEFGNRETLGRFVREHHVHYEVEHEEVAEGGKRDLVALRLRIFATHERSKLSVPGCPICVKLQLELTSLAEHVVRASEAVDRTEIVPGRRALYQSSVVPDADEIAVVLRVRCDSPGHPRKGAGEEGCLGEIKDRLAEMGVPRR